MIVFAFQLFISSKIYRAVDDYSSQTHEAEIIHHSSESLDWEELSPCMAQFIHVALRLRGTDCEVCWYFAHAFYWHKLADWDGDCIRYKANQGSDFIMQ